MSLPAPLSKATMGPNSLGGLQQYAVRIDLMSATATNAVAFAIDGDQELASVAFVPDMNIAANGTNYWTIELFNKGTAGAGTTAMFVAVDTRAASLNGLTRDDAEVFTLTSPSLADGEVAALVFTKAASAANLSGTVFITVKRLCTY